MTEKAKLAEQQARGARAEAILKDPLVVRAFEAIEATIDEAWKSTQADEHEQRHNAYLMWRLVKNLRGAFEQHVRTGEFARRQLLELEDDHPKGKR